MRHLIIAANSRIWRAGVAIAVVFVLGCVDHAAGQTITTTILGTVSDDAGRLPGASVSAKNVETGFTNEAKTDTQGTYTLQGIRPGTYDITVSVDQHKPETRTVQVLIGRPATLNFLLVASPTFTERVDVVGGAD